MRLKFRILVIFMLVFFVSTGFSSCGLINVKVEVQSGDSSSVEYGLGDFIPVKSNLLENPLTLIFEIRTTEDCLNGSDVSFKLTDIGVFKSPDAFTKEATDIGYYIYRAKYVFNDDVTLSYPFQGFLKIAMNGAVNEYSLNFKPDDEAPVVMVSGVPTGIVGNGTSFEMGLEIYDNTRLSTYCINNWCNITNLSYVSFKKEVSVSETTEITVSATDVLGNQKIVRIPVVVDNKPPEIVNPTIVVSNPPDLELSVTVDIKDDSLKYGKGVSVVGDFSEVNPSMNAVSGFCKQYEDVVKCSWSNIPVSLDSSKLVNLHLKAEDVFGHVASVDVPINIFIDREPPKIEEFYVKNSLGNKNIFSAYSNSNILVYLKVDDKSGIDRILSDFGGIYFLNPDDSLSDPDNGLFVWNISPDVFSAYKSVKNDTLIFSVVVYDSFGNRANSSVEVTLDNQPPEIISKKFYNQDKNERLVKGDLMYSGATMIYKIVVSNDVDINNVYGDFSSVALDYSTNKFKKASCGVYDEDNSLIECTFSNIKLVNGYINGTVFLYVYDEAGNLDVEKDNIEVFKIGTEPVNAFYIEDINITNPLPRDLILDGYDVVGWFKGVVKKRPGFDDMKIISYMLADTPICNDSDLQPLMLESTELYPDPYGGPDPNFIIKATLIPIQDINALEGGYATCHLTISKRDDKTIYPEETVEFKIRFKFYNVPRGTVLRAKAEMLKDEIDSLKGWQRKYEKYYKWYSMYYNACRGLNAVWGGLATVSEVVGILAKIYKFLEPASQTLVCGQTTIGTNVNNLRDSLGKMCFLANCDVWEKVGFGKYVKSIEDRVNDWMVGWNICRVAGSNNGKSSEESEVPETTPLGSQKENDLFH